MAISPILHSECLVSDVQRNLGSPNICGIRVVLTDYSPPPQHAEGAGYKFDNSLTISKCLSYCDSQGAAYAGVENGNQCFCSQQGLQNGGTYSNPPGSALTASANGGCSSNCGGDSSLACGGPNHIQVYRSNARRTPTVPTVAGASYLGCYSDNVNNRLLPVWSSGNDQSNTNAKCVASCRYLGYDLAGTEYSQEW